MKIDRTQGRERAGSQRPKKKLLKKNRRGLRLEICYVLPI